MALIDHIPDIPDEYLVEIGRICRRWSVLESLMHICTVKVAGMDIQRASSLIIFAHMSFPLRLDVLGAIVEAANFNGKYPWLADYPRVDKLLRKAQKERNAVIHATWGDEGGAMHMGGFSAHGSLKILSKPISVAELRTSADAIYEAAEELHALIMHDGVVKGPPPQSGQ